MRGRTIIVGVGVWLTCSDAWMGQSARRPSISRTRQATLSEDGARTFDLVVIGGGSAGLTAAKFASTFGKSVVIIEKDRLGGDCTWTGCVPSKTLLAAAKVAHTARTASLYGVSTGEVSVDFDVVKARVRSAIQKLYDQDDAPDALTKRGIDTMTGAATFVDSSTLEVMAASGTTIVRAKEGVIVATGASPAVPAIAGLAEVPHVTYEQIFELERLPETLTVVGGGPIGCELAQGFSRLGSCVTLVAPQLLPGNEPEASDAIEAVLQREGVRRVRSRATAVRREGSGHALSVEAEGEAEVVGGTLLIAVGRRPVVGGLNLEAAGVELDGATGGIAVDAKLRTSGTGGCVYAAGDCTGGAQYTHYAGFQGAIAARNILLPLTDAGVVAERLPGVTFTSPQVASIGMSEAAAVAAYGREAVRVETKPMSAVDRAVCDGVDDGLIKLVVRARDGSLLGATVVAEPAGELISEIAVAMAAGVKLPALASIIHPYPSYAIELQRMAANVYYDSLKKNAGLYDVLKKVGL